MNWNEYYIKINNSKPSNLLRRFSEMNVVRRTAIDLGCGSGKDTIFLLKNGYKVYAIDKKEIIKKYIDDKIDKEEKMRLEYIIKDFGEIEFPKVDLINANLSISFCNPNKIDNLLKNIKSSINIDGFFVGNFLGILDDWNTNKNMTFFTEQQIKETFKNFKIIYFNEITENKKAVNGNLKHWHIYELIAYKSKN